MKKIFLISLISLFVSTNLVASDYGLVNNIHETDPGKLYRSAQLKDHELKKLILKRKIKTVINLRGEGVDKDWYQKELRASNELGVAHFDIAMSASRLPHKDDLRKLLALYETAERPILIHCLAGADRTGEAAALYQMIYMGKSKDEAIKQLSIRFFHLPSAKPAKRYFIRDVWQGVEWAKNSYDPCKADYRYYNREQFCNTPTQVSEDDTDSDS
ncbi:MAG: tyrosine-protein phosphatase [Bdellovibrionales bacterium]|nr:tyrosine-protein phosphatase [Bdellovibrionales bacterium]